MVTGLHQNGAYLQAMAKPSKHQHLTSYIFPNFGDPNLSPEKSDNVEASLKYTGRQWNAGLTIFEKQDQGLELHFLEPQPLVARSLAFALLISEKPKYKARLLMAAGISLTRYY